MPQASSLYQSPLLSNIAADFKNREYIADQILTPVQVPKKQGQYIVWDQGVTFKAPRTQYGQDGSPGMIDVKGVKTPFSLNTEALSVLIDEEEEWQCPEAQIRAMKTIKLANAMRMRLELDVAAILRSTATMTSNATLSGTSQWSDFVNSDPIGAILTAADSLPRAPNVLIAGRDVISKLRTHTKILSAIQYVQMGGIAPLDALAALFQVEKIIIGDAFQDTAADGQPQVKSRIWGKDAILAYVDQSPPSPLMDQPTLGYLPRVGGSGTAPWRAYTAVNPFRGTGGGHQFVKLETTYGVLVSAPSMGFLWKTAVA